MPKFRIEAEQTKYYTVIIEAESEDDANNIVDKWNEDDFQIDYKYGSWYIGEALEIEEKE